MKIRYHIKSLMEDKLVSLREASKNSGIDQNYLRVLINRKVLRAVKVGRDWFVTENGLSDYTKKHSRKKNHFAVNQITAIKEIEKNDTEPLKTYFADSRRVLLREQHWQETLLSARKENLVSFLNDKKYSIHIDRLEKRYDKLLKPAPKRYVSFYNGLKKPNFAKTAVLAAALLLTIYAIAKPGDLSRLASLSQDLASAFGAINSSVTKLGEAPANLLAGIFPNFQPLLVRFLLGGGIRESVNLPGETIELAAPAPTKIEVTRPVVTKDVTKETQVKQIVETIERIVPADYNRLKDELTRSFEVNNNELRKEIAGLADELFSIQGQLTTTSRVSNSSIQMVTLSQKIDQLHNLTITDGLTVSSGDLTVSNGSVTAPSATFVNLTITGSCTGCGGSGAQTPWTSNINGGGFSLTNAGNLTFTYFTGTSTSATSTLTTGGFAIGTNQFVVEQTSGKVGIGTSSPSQLFSVVGSGYITGGLGIGIATTTSGNLQVAGDIQTQNITINGTCSGCGSGSGSVTSGTFGRLAYYSAGTSVSSADFLVIATSSSSSRFGIGTTTFSELLTVGGNAFIGGNITATGTLSVVSLATLTGGILSNSSTSTITNLTMTLSTSTSATSTSLFAINATISTSTIGNLLAGTVTATSTSASSSFQNLLFVQGQGTGLSLSNLTVSASTTLTNAGVLGNFFIGDNLADQLTVTATTTFQTGLTLNGVGLSIIGAGDLSIADDATILGGLGIGIATTTNTNLQVAGDTQLTGALSVTASTSLQNLGASGSIFLGDTSTDLLTVTASSTFVSNAGFLGNLQIGDASTDSITINAGLFNFTNQATSTLKNDLANAFTLATSTNASGTLAIFTISTASTTSSGQGAVGIGTSSPSGLAKLNVGGVVASLNLGNINTWTGGQTFNLSTSTSATSTSLFAINATISTSTIGNLLAGTVTATSTSASSSFQNLLFVQGQGTGLSLSNLTVSASTTLTNAGVLGNFFIGDNLADQLTVTATTTFQTGLTLNGVGLSIIGAGDLSIADDATILGGLGIGIATTTNTNLQVAGDTQLTGALSVTASTSLQNLGASGSIFLGDTSTDLLTVTASSTFVSNAGFLGNLQIGDASSDSLT